MSRTPNDDRSDAKNPTSDAYRADQENRYGDGGDDEEREAEVAPGEVTTSGARTLFGPDPHPILGRLANRLPSAAKNFGQKAFVDTVPLDEAFALAFASDESEARDRALAIEELLSVADWILTLAHEVMLRQGNKATLQREQTEDGPMLTLAYGDKHELVLRGSKRYEVVVFGREKEPDEHGVRRPSFEKAFKFAKLRWHSAIERERGFRFDHNRTDEEDREARRREHEVVAYHAEREVVDPAQQLVDAIKEWGKR